MYRVKNRLETSNRDFLVNVKIKGSSLLGEIQLAVSDKSLDDRQGYLDHFNHFLYELSRAKYGPVAEAIVLSSHLTDSVPYFDKALSSTRTKSPAFNVEVFLDTKDEVNIPGWSESENDETYVCSNCIELKKAYHSPFRCLRKEAERSVRVCGECVLRALRPDSRGSYMLGSKLASFFQPAQEGESLQCQYICAIPKTTSEKNILALKKY